MTTSEMLHNAANHIDKYGWIKNTYGAPEAPSCAVGAIAHANGMDFDGWNDNEDFQAAVEALSGVLTLTGDYGDDPESRILNWNDNEAERASQVSAALRMAATRAV